MSLANGLSILFIFSKHQLLVLLIFASVSFISFSFIYFSSGLYFLYYKLSLDVWQSLISSSYFQSHSYKAHWKL